MSGTLLSDRIRKAAHGLHRCGWCGNAIATREEYRDQRIADDGTVYTWREHQRCGWFVSRHLEAWEYEEIYNPRETYNDLVAEHGMPA